MTVPQLAPDQAQAAVSQGAVIVDVREDDEVAAGRIPGALHAPLSRFMTHLDDLPKDRMLIVQCAIGGRSQQAAAWLQSQGYDAVNLAGGIQGWAAAGLQVE